MLEQINQLPAVCRRPAQELTRGKTTEEDIQRWLHCPPSYSLLYIGVYNEFTSNTAHILAQHDVTLISRFKLSYLLI